MLSFRWCRWPMTPLKQGIPVKYDSMTVWLHFSGTFEHCMSFECETLDASWWVLLECHLGRKVIWPFVRRKWPRWRPTWHSYRLLDLTARKSWIPVYPLSNSPSFRRIWRKEWKPCSDRCKQNWRLEKWWCCHIHGCFLYKGVSKNRGTPQIINFYRVFPL